MGTPFDFAAGAAGLVSLSVTAFQGCVKAFQLISTARSMGEDADRIRTLLEWEQLRLISWGSRAGLNHGGVRDPRLKWTMILEILKQLEILLSDAEILKKRFNLVEDKDQSQPPTPQVEKLGVRKLWTYVKRQIRTERARMISESTSSFRKLKWAVIDQDRIKELVAQISQ